MSDAPVKGPAYYIEKTYGRLIAEWQDIMRQRCRAKHIALVAMPRRKHGMGHGDANAVIAYTLAEAEG